MGLGDTRLWELEQRFEQWSLLRECEQRSFEFELEHPGAPSFSLRQIYPLFRLVIFSRTHLSRAVETPALPSRKILLKQAWLVLKRTL